LFPRLSPTPDGPHKPGIVPCPPQPKNRSAALGGQSSRPSVSDGRQPPADARMAAGRTTVARLVRAVVGLWDSKKERVCPPEEGTRHVLPTNCCLDEAQSVAVFDDENHNRREDASQRTRRNEDADSLPGPSSKADGIFLLHNKIRGLGHSTNQTITRGGTRWAGELLPGCAALHVRSYRRQVANLGPCDALRAEACHALGSEA